MKYSLLLSTPLFLCRQYHVLSPVGWVQGHVQQKEKDQYDFTVKENQVMRYDDDNHHRNFLNKIYFLLLEKKKEERKCGWLALEKMRGKQSNTRNNLTIAFVCINMKRPGFPV